MSDQTELFAIQPLKNEQNKDVEISTMVRRLKEEHLLIPKFQRKFCWSDTQVKGWIDSVIQKKPVGVIVTYQLANGGPTYLADGYQRLTATQKFIDNPQFFGYGPDQAREYCDAFEVTVQHRIYPDHVEAMRAFQKLNRGTSLTTLEFYMGELSLLDAGEIIVKQVPLIVERYETPLLKQRKVKRTNRVADHKRTRDCYGLFLQYISEWTYMSFWDVSRTGAEMGSEPVVERALADFLKSRGMLLADVERCIDNFNTFMGLQAIEIATLRKDAGCEGMAINLTLLHWILHLAVWKKNNQRPVKSYQDLVSKIFVHLRNQYGQLKSRFDLPLEPKQTVTLQLGSLSQLSLLCRAFNSDLYEGQRRSRKLTASAGYHMSHAQPFSTHGDGATFPESGTRNMARGAKPVE